MDLIKKAKEAFELLAQARGMLTEVKDAMTDGSAAISANQIGELRVMLEQEDQETKDAINEARAAIADYRRG